MDRIEQLERFVEENNLHHGYAGYWEAAPIDSLSGSRVRAYPVEPCGASLQQYCPFRRPHHRVLVRAQEGRECSGSSAIRS